MTLSIHERRRSLPYRVSVFAFGVAAYAFGVGALIVLILIMLGVLPFTGGPLGKLSLGRRLRSTHRCSSSSRFSTA